MNAPPLQRDRLFRPALRDGAQVKFIGLGGIGSIVARYGALFLASLDREVRVVFVDGDSFEPSNSNRMLFGDFGNKAQVTVEALLPFFTQSRLTLVAVEQFITPENIGRLICEDDLVMLCVDNHATRKLVSDHCGRLRNIYLVSGGNDAAGPDSSGIVRRGTYGNVQVHIRKDGHELAPSLACYHPEIAAPADRAPHNKACTELLTSTPQILFTNLAVASAMLNALWLVLTDAIHYSELSLDIADGRMRPTLPLVTTLAPLARPSSAHMKP